MSGTSLEAALILTAAGSSRRMGTGKKKEFQTISGMPVLVMALKPFIAAGLFKNIVIVLNSDDLEKGKALLSEMPGAENFIFVSGGSTRRESVYNGLKLLEKHNPDIVLIHDGARPWITETVIMNVVSETERTGASIPVVPSVNAMKSLDYEGYIIAHLDRNRTVGAQTPQGFLFPEILRAHRAAATDGCEYIDDSEIYQKYAGRVAAVEGDPGNRKITYADDLKER